MSTMTSDRRPTGRIQSRLLGPTGGRSLSIAVLVGATVSVVAWSLLPGAFAAAALFGPLVAGYLLNEGSNRGGTAGVASLAVSTPLQFALAAVPALDVPSPFVLSAPVDASPTELLLFVLITVVLVALLVALGASLGAIGGEFGPGGPSPTDE